MRQDIQGIRGFAIILVLLFHFRPQQFPNGFVGVDMFFVVSGYLMVMIFAKTDPLSPLGIIDFYYRRVRRLCPLYFLTVFIVFAVSQLFLSSSWIQLNNRNFVYVLSFTKNLRTVWDHNDYFNNFRSTDKVVDLYLHTWSLDVEIQFYMIVPFLLMILSFAPKKLHPALLILLIMASFLHYFTSTVIYAFNMLFARIWQFGLGMLAFNVNTFIYSTINEKGADRVGHNLCEVVSWIPFCSLFIPMLPFPLLNLFIQPVICLATAALLCFGSETNPSILSLPSLGYIGDISYTLYLVHWPVIALVITKGSIQEVQTAVALTLVISVFLHHCIDIHIRNLDKRTLLLVVGVLIFLCGSVLGITSFLPPFFFSHNAEVPNRLINPIRTNLEFASTPIQSRLSCRDVSQENGFSLFKWPWGICSYPNGSGTQNVLVVGNSYAINQGETVWKEFRGNYNTFRIFSMPVFQVLADIEENSEDRQLQNVHRVGMEMIKRIQPDVIIVAIRHQGSQNSPFFGKSVDLLLKEYNSNIQILEGISHKIFIQDVHPAYPLLHLTHFIEALERKGDLTKFHLDRQEADEEMDSAKRRLAALKCEKCEIFNTAGPFLRDDKYLAFDPSTNLSFIDNDMHLTPAGLNRLSSIYRSIAHKAL